MEKEADVSHDLIESAISCEEFVEEFCDASNRYETHIRELFSQIIIERNSLKQRIVDLEGKTDELEKKLGEKRQNYAVNMKKMKKENASLRQENKDLKAKIACIASGQNVMKKEIHSSEVKSHSPAPKGPEIPSIATKTPVTDAITANNNSIMSADDSIELSD